MPPTAAETALDRLRKAVADAPADRSTITEDGKVSTTKALAKVFAADVVAVLAGASDPVGIALRDGAAAAIPPDSRNPGELVVYQNASDIRKALESVG